MSLAHLITLARGKSGFGMMYSPLGRFPVTSRFMRAPYGLAKGVIFGLLSLTWALAMTAPAILITLHPLDQSLIYFTTARCLIRGLPIIQGGRNLFRIESNRPDPGGTGLCPGA
jgi:hypothetical protein